ncbi:ATP-binding protein [Halobacteriovorax sp. HFRX-2_2]|uniref:sensor histidine kinase n=1 Tax=unclassified Halobacteriovorax TaxID=2639665 RepID=UPI0037236851
MDKTPARFSFIIPIVMGVVLTLSFFVLGIAAYHIHSNQEKVRFENDREIISRQIVDSLKLPIWNLNREYIQKISNVFVNSSDQTVTSITVKDENGNLLSHISLVEAPAPKYVHPEIIIENFDVSYEGKNIGNVEIIFSNRLNAVYVHNIMKMIGMWFASGLILSLIVTSFAYYYLFFSPLKHFVNRTSLIASGDFRPIREKFALNELSFFAKTLNKTLKEIILRDEKLKQYNVELEATVSKRTQELYEQRERSHESERLAALGQMAAGIAHEINNPLFVILGNLNRLKKCVSGEKCEYILEKVEVAADRITEIVKSMSTMSRDGQKDLKTVIRCEELESIVLAICKGRLAEKEIGLSFHYDKSPQGNLIYANKTQISQVLVNLINNSIDAIEDLEERHINVVIKQNFENLFIEVIDSGNGIDPRIESRIMEPFYTTKDVNKGTGLGLSLSYEMMLNNDGYLKYDPKSENTKFIISLPKYSGAMSEHLH